jgi:hypothetical protein
MRQPGTKRLELTKVIETIGPDLVEKNGIRDSFYQEGGYHQQLLQVCACCGARPFFAVPCNHILN